MTLREELIELIRIGKERGLLKAVAWFDGFIQKQEAISKKAKK